MIHRGWSPGFRSPQIRYRIFALYLAISSVQLAAMYIAKVVVRGELYYDAREYWLPNAQAIADGAVLYVTVHDNKPPLFYYINQTVYSTGYYAEVFYLLIAVANALIAYSLFHWLSQHSRARAGILAGTLFIVSIPLIRSNQINVRSLSMLFVMLSVFTVSPSARGAYLAAGTLISQFTVFAIPALLWDGIRKSDNEISWAVKYCVSGLVTGGLLFLPLWIVWGPDAVVGGVMDSFYSVNQYMLDKMDRYNPVLNPVGYLEHLAQKSLQLGYILVPTVLTWIAVRRRLIRPLPPIGLATALAVSFALSLGIRSLHYYWYPIVMFCAVVSGIGISQWLRTTQNVI